ncbi:hypothetical protein EB118_20850 [bacterium]|nr:hypothetical protein [Synechococcaceae bacterium WB6_1A_059]NDG32509.1 hypothetical protein [bacterium]NDG79905.1 hypothetical protein [Synechococcaceae bacterium WB8_1B_057]
MKKQQKPQLNEGLRTADLKHCVAETFSIDRYSSKMGEDSDVVVLGFHARDKNAAKDLMEFIEKGFPFILDSDMSTGEEYDGKYQVFAEIQRTEHIGEQIETLMKGISQLCDCYTWQFRYQKDNRSIDFSKDSILEHVPTNKNDYDSRITEYKQTAISDFFDQGSVDVMLEGQTLTFKKPYAEPITAKFIAIGDYEVVKKHVPGKLSLDESNQGQCVFLTKYLGTYDIDKIGNRFLISRGDQAVVVEKELW